MAGPSQIYHDIHARDNTRQHIGNAYYINYGTDSQLPQSALSQDHSLPSQDGWMIRFANQLSRTNRSAARAQALFERMSPYEPLPTLNRIQYRHLENTTQWLAKHTTFVEWHSSSDPYAFLWLSGKVGCGKTFAMATAVEHLITSVQKDHKDRVLHYFYQYPCNRATDLFRSLSKQLVECLIQKDQQCTPELVAQLDRCFGDVNRTSDIQDVVEYILVPLISQFGNIVICIDGIEECTFEEQVMVRDGLRRISQRKPFKTLITGENETKLPTLSNEATSFRVRLDDDGSRTGTQLDGHGQISDDIGTYIDCRLSDLSGPDQLFHDLGLRERARRELMSKSNCMFLWVHLQLDILADCETPAEVDLALKELPPTIQDTYIRCLKRTKHGKRLCKPKILKWSLATREPLRLDDLRAMIAIDSETGEFHPQNMPSIESIKRSAVGLLSFEGADRLSVPTHHSVRQFFFSPTLGDRLANDCSQFDELTFKELTLSINESTHDIAQISLMHIRSRTGLAVVMRQYITNPPIQASIPNTLRWILRLRGKPNVQLPVPLSPRFVHKGDDNDFLQYAIRTWTVHTKMITDQDTCWSVFRQVALEPNVSWNIHPWQSIGGTVTSHLRGLLGYAVSHDHAPLLQVLADSSAMKSEIYDQVLPGNGLLPALHVAAHAGYDGIVRMLLPLCNVNAVCPQLGRTALHYAAAAGRRDTVALLRGVEGLQVGSRDKDGASAFELAHSNEHYSVLALLLDATCESSQTWLLHAAAHRGDEPMVRLLLGSKNFNANAVESYGWTPLHRVAASEGCESIMSFLLSSEKVDANARDAHGRTALHIAAEKEERLSTVQLLLNSKKVDANIRDMSGRTPLHVAIQNEGTESILKALLSSEKVDANLTDSRYGASYGRTPLQLATEKEGRLSKLKLLLNSEKVDPYINASGDTLLHLAAGIGHEQIVRVILGSEKFDLNALDLYSRTPLHTAILCSHESVVRLLLNSEKVDINIRDNAGSTPLHLAVAKRDESIIRLLLSSRIAGLNPGDHAGQTPLHLAVRFEQHSIIRLLCSENVDLNAKDNTGQTSLHLAVCKQDKSILELLLNLGANLNAQDNIGQTPLHIAVQKMSEESVKLLLHSEHVNPDIKDELGKTPLHLALGRVQQSDADRLVFRWPQVCIKLLLAKVDLNVQDNHGWTPLHLAVYEGWEASISLLLEKADPNIKNSYGWTPLHMAVHKGFNSKVSLLLAKADPDIKDNHGLTPLCMAVNNGSYPIAELLLEKADPNIKDDHGWTPLCIAINEGNEPIAKLIFEKIAINAGDDHGWELLCNLLSKNDDSIARLLVENAEPRENHGDRATDIGCDRSWETLRRALQEADEDLWKLLISRVSEIGKLL